MALSSGLALNDGLAVAGGGGGGGGDANNILGGAANQLLYQVATDVTGFVAAPTLGGTYLQWDGAAFIWTGATSGITVGSTAIGGGTDTRVLFDDAGTLGEYPISGTGSVAMTNSPTLVTPALGTPSAVNLANATNLPMSAIASLDANVAVWLATPTSANLAAAVTNETGSGALVFATSPTLVTPALGTPSAINLANATNLPISAIASLGTGVGTWLATPSSANLAAAVTDETGSGSLVFATSPTLVTPALGTPSAVNLANATNLPISAIASLGAGVGTWLATPSSANLATAVTDETGSGSLVFANTPTLVTPVIGAATGTSLAVTAALTAYSGTAIPAGGTTGSGVKFSSTGNYGVFFGSGAPTLSAAQGSLYLRSDGSPYFNTDGSTGWTALSAGALTVGTSTIAGGTNTRVLFDNSGVLGEYPITGTTNVVMSASPTLTGTITAAAANFSGAVSTAALSSAAHTVTSSSANSLAVGPNGTTNPVFNIDSSTASQAAGLNLTGAVAAGTVALAVISSGANASLSIDAKGSGTLTLQGTATGAITLSRATTLSAALTYGGVTLNNAVTGTGNMVLSASPTLSGTVGGALTFSGALTLSSALTYGGVTLNNAVTGTGNMVLSASPTLTGTLAAADITNGGTFVQTSNSATAFVSGPNGATNPVFTLVNNTGSQAAGLRVTGATAAGTVALDVTSSGANAGLSIDAKGSGTITIAGTSTGAITLTRATTLSAALTYGGVTLSNSVTGTGSMVLSASPTLTGTLAAAAITASSTITQTSNSATAFTSGPNGSTNPVFTLVNSTASQAAGLRVTGATSAGTVALDVTSSGSNASLSIDAKGSGTITLGGTSTGAITLTRATTLSAALTYGGVTLSNAVTGTGNMVLSSTPTLTTPVIGAATGTSLSVTGALTAGSGTAIAAGGSTTGVTISSTSSFGLFVGSGAPTISRAQGSLYLRSDGVPYYNTNGTTGWNALVPAGAVTTSGLTMTTSRLLGRTTASTGAIEEITADSNALTLSSTTLSVKSGNWVLIASSNPSGSSTCDFTGFNSSLYEEYKIIWWGLAPSSDDFLLFRTSTNGGSSYDSGASDYLTLYGQPDTTYYRQLGAGIATSAGFFCSENIESSTNYLCFGEVTILSPQTAQYFVSYFNMTYFMAGSAIQFQSTGSNWRTTAADVDAVRFFFGTATFASTTQFRFYGRRK